MNYHPVQRTHASSRSNKSWRQISSFGAWSILLIWGISCKFVPRESENGNDITASSPLPERVLYFPNDRSVGRVTITETVQEARSALSQYASNAITREAKGEVTIPSGAAVRLDLRQVPSERPFLKTPAPSDIQVLHFTSQGYQNLPVPNTRSLGALSGLDKLELSGPSNGFRDIDEIRGELVDITRSVLPHLKHLTNLRVLSLHDTNVWDQDFVHLQNLKRLDTLELRSTNVSGRAFDYIAKLKNIKTLRLTFLYPGIYDTHLDFLKNYPNLEELDLMGTEVPYLEVPGVGMNPNAHTHYHESSSLESRYVKEDMECMKGLASATSLRKLNLSMMLFSDAHLASLQTLTQLQELDLGCNGLLENLPPTITSNTSLRILKLKWTNIGDNSLKILASMTSLEELDLQETKITDAGIPHLAQLKSLKKLNINATSISADGKVRLKEDLPHCEFAEDWRQHRELPRNPSVPTPVAIPPTTPKGSSTFTIRLRLHTRQN